MEDRQGGNSMACPVCDKSMRRLSTAHAIPPFWKRLPSMFRYPLNAGSMIYLSGLAIFALLTRVPIVPIVFVVVLLLPLMMMRYGFSVLQHTAMGHMKPPRLALNFHLHELALPLKLYGLMLVLSMLTTFLLFPFRVSMDVIQLISFIELQLMLPAMVVLLAVYRSFFRALNPVDIGSVISTIGLPYLALCGMLLLLSGGPGSLVYLLPGGFPAWIQTMLFVFISGYFTIVNFHLLGYVVYQFHEQLGIKPEIEYDVRPAKTRSAKAPAADGATYPTLQKVRLLLKEGKQQAAMAALKRELSRLAEMDEARAEMHQLYHRMLLETEDKEQLLDHAREYISRLLDQGRGKQALGVMRDCLSRDKDFRPTNPEEVHQLIRVAYQAEDHRMVVALANGFLRRFPDYPDVIDPLLLAAKSLHHHFNQEDKASTILQFILKESLKNSPVSV
ncbi:MAG: hypothetical protein D6698_13085 [Gammaproteobacteria bacterium]|nr:MAG: hypothetical protein D6698_13085 [Gammaproteobacteria bacterium]